RLFYANLLGLLGSVILADRLGGMRELRVVARDQDLGDDGRHMPPDAFAAKHLEREPLNHVAHTALRIGDAGIHGKPRHTTLSLFDTDQNVADLRAVA